MKPPVCLTTTKKNFYVQRPKVQSVVLVPWKNIPKSLFIAVENLQGEPKTLGNRMECADLEIPCFTGRESNTLVEVKEITPAVSRVTRQKMNYKALDLGSKKYM